MVKVRLCFASRRVKHIWGVVGLARSPDGSAPGKREARAEGASVKVVIHNTNREGETKQWLPDQEMTKLWWQVPA